MIRVLFLTDRPPARVLPAVPPLLLDIKTDDLSVTAADAVLAVGPDAILVDAAENPGQGFAVLRALRERGVKGPVMVVVERRDVDRFSWDEVADDAIYPSAPEGEIRLRFAMAWRRVGGGGDPTLRLGAIALDPTTFRVSVEGRPLDLTFKEFELLRYLAERPGRVVTRPTLMREVWRYDFYGGTRTVDVHVRRLRAKLGPEHEAVIETVRGVGYRAADQDPSRTGRG